MKPGRRFRLVTVLFSLCLLLLAQGVLAGYFCQDAAAMTTAAAADEPECAAAMATSDDQERGLCHAHCQSGSQSADSFQPPAPLDVRELSGALTVQLPAPERFQPSGPQPGLLQRSSAPSIALQHCCFRT